MTDVPDAIVLETHRDLARRVGEVWIRRALLLLLLAVLVVAVLNLFGQETTATTASAGTVRLKVSAPPRLRGGLIYQVRFEIASRRELKDAQLVLSSEWLDGMSVNTIEPSPVGEASRDGSLALDLGHIRSGDRYVLFMQFQVNPTTVGRRHAKLDLYDGGVHLLRINRAMTIFP